MAELSFLSLKGRLRQTVVDSLVSKPVPSLLQSFQWTLGLIDQIAEYVADDMLAHHIEPLQQKNYELKAQADLQAEVIRDLRVQLERASAGGMY